MSLQSTDCEKLTKRHERSTGSTTVPIQKLFPATGHLCLGEICRTVSHRPATATPGHGTVTLVLWGPVRISARRAGAQAATGSFFRDELFFVAARCRAEAMRYSPSRLRWREYRESR